MSAQIDSPYINKSSREVYGLVLTEMAGQDERIVAVTADVPESLRLVKFKETYPDRLFNFGIAEQNMMAAAAGLARAGKVPYVSVYSIFAALRATEQARTDVAYGNLPVRICVSHSGVSLGPAGPSHHSIEDVAVYRVMANMTVIVPADGVETAEALRATKDLPGPLFMRMNRIVEPTVYRSESGFTLGKGRVLREGGDLTIMACGVCVSSALQAAEMLAGEGLQVRVVDMATIKPIDREEVLASAAKTGAILTVEEHTTFGGLGTAAAEVLAEAGVSVRFKRHGIPDIYTLAGMYPELLAYYRLDGPGVAQAAREFMR